MAKICEEREENEVGRRNGRPDLKMIGEEEEKRRRGEEEKRRWGGGEAKKL